MPQYYRNMKTFTISQAAKESGLTPRAVRLYERDGLIPYAERTETGYRTYTENDLSLLRFIHQARELGLGLDEIKQILDLQNSGVTPCSTVQNLVETHIRDIDEKIRSLRELRSTLVKVRQFALDSNMRGEDAIVCRIIERSVS